MIVNFSVQNFGSVKEKQTLSFEADKSIHLEDHYIIKTGGLRLLKLALIYGANASGKTTILTALHFLKGLVIAPKREKTGILGFNPFLFSEKTPSQTSIITISFIEDEIRYAYEIEFMQMAIVREELNFFSPNKANIFKRTTNLTQQFTKITFGSKIKLKKGFKTILEANTLWNNTVLGGFLKTNIELEELTKVTNWFFHTLGSLTFPTIQIHNEISLFISKNIISKKSILEILKKADFNISNINLNAKEKDIDNKYLDILEKTFTNTREEIQEIRNKGKIPIFTDLQIEHTINNERYTLPFILESEGTRRYYGFAGLLSLLITTSTIISIDELEASLHPDLYKHFLLTFLMNAKKSQLIATTHNREILDNKDIFRDDAIWFTEKGENGATELYSLADFDSSMVRDTTNILNAYKAGRLGAVPNLGDYYIDIDND